MMTSAPLFMLVFVVGLTYVAPARQQYYVDVSFIVDPSVINWYQTFDMDKETAKRTFRDDLEIQLFETNNIFKSLIKSGLNIEIRQMELMFTEREVFSKNAIHNQTVGGHHGVLEFMQYLRKFQMFNKNRYNMAVLLTGFHLRGEGVYVPEVTIRDSMCEPFALAVVRTDGTAAMSRGLSRAIAQSLGAPIDTGKCQQTGRYIMAPLLRPLHHRAFSSCSSNGILNYISKLDKTHNNCLERTNAPKLAIKRESADESRGYFQPDIICQRAMLDPNTYACKIPKEKRKHGVCQVLWCYNRKTRKCRASFTPYGMVCGTGKRCRRGRCLPHSPTTQEPNKTVPTTRPVKTVPTRPTQPPTRPTQPPTRPAPRPGSARNVLEVYVLVEPEAVRKYKTWGYSDAVVKDQIRQELMSGFEEVNQMYHSLREYGLELEIRVQGINFAPEEVFSGNDVNGKNLVTTTAIDKLGEYLKKHNIPQHDAAIVLTGFDLTGSGGYNGPTGYASVKAACTERALGAIEVSGTAWTPFFIAHEIGHILGAEHDGNQNNCLRDRKESYIMAVQGELTSVNRWKFSPCTKDYFANYIAELEKDNKNCMLDTSMSPMNYPPRAKDTLDPDVICRRTFGDNFIVNKIPMFYESKVMKGDSICKYIPCQKIDAGMSVKFGYASEGTVCDVGKRCKLSKCVAAPSDFPTPSNLDPDCLLGDTKSIDIVTNQHGGCDNVITQATASHCNTPFIKAQCCNTCKKFKTSR